jgi:hypothetical protein
MGRPHLPDSNGRTVPERRRLLIRQSFRQLRLLVAGAAVLLAVYVWLVMRIHG